MSNVYQMDKQTTSAIIKRAADQQESLTAQAMRKMAESLRLQAEVVDALALAIVGGSDSDMLRSIDVQRVLNCGPSKACAIIRTFGTGGGKMGRITRGRLMELQREGRLSGIK